MNPAVSVVIPTKNAGELFQSVLSRLVLQKTDFPVEIVVVDSGSTDHTCAVAGLFGARVHRISPRRFNHGLTRNLGIRLSRGTFIVLMTQDALPADEHLLANLIRPFQDGGVAGVFAAQIPRADADPVTRRHLNNWVTAGKESYECRISDPASFCLQPPMEQFRTCVFDNVCAAVRRRTWEAIPFAETPFGEDVDFSRRALMAGWKIRFEPTAAVIHSHNRSLWYEYKRTYICHFTLNRLFGLQTVPSFRHVVRSVIRGTLMDAKTVMAERRVHGPVRPLLGLFRLPFLSLSAVWGQYRGARDRRRNRGKPVSGV
jgi:rhamnosyltransferase